jgi:TonB family protein
MLRQRLALAAVFVLAPGASFLPPPPRADDVSGAPPGAATDARRPDIRLRARELSVPSISLTLPDPGWPEGSIEEGRFGIGVIVLVAVDESGRVVDASDGPVHWYLRDTAGDWIRRPGPYSGDDLLDLRRAAVAGALQSRFAVPDSASGGRSGPRRGRVEFRWELAEDRRLAGGRALVVSGAEYDIGLIPAPGKSEAEVTSPVVVHKHPPEYPADARAAGAEGSVIVQVEIDTTGAVVGVGLLDVRGGAAGFTSMVDNALNAARQWRFKPATVDGRPVAVLNTVVIEYRLN